MSCRITCLHVCARMRVCMAVHAHALQFAQSVDQGLGFSRPNPTQFPPCLYGHVLRQLSWRVLFTHMTSHSAVRASQAGKQKQGR